MNLSKELGLPGSTLSQYENGKRQISIEKAKKLAECLGLAYEEIKNRKGKMVNGTFVKESDL